MPESVEIEWTEPIEPGVMMAVLELLLSAPARRYDDPGEHQEAARWRRQ